MMADPVEGRKADSIRDVLIMTERTNGGVGREIILFINQSASNWLINPL
jgi:hypothetical protein